MTKPPDLHSTSLDTFLHDAPCQYTYRFENNKCAWIHAYLLCNHDRTHSFVWAIAIEYTNIQINSSSTTYQSFFIFNRLVMHYFPLNITERGSFGLAFKQVRRMPCLTNANPCVLPRTIATKSLKLSMLPSFHCISTFLQKITKHYH